MKLDELLSRFHQVADHPADRLKAYLAAGEKVVAVAPVYTPEEVIHAMGLIPMGVWGADTELGEAKGYFPAFICSVMQSILELGIRGAYAGVSALVVPSLCDSLKTLGQNWKYAVPSIPFVPMTYPQNRSGEVGVAYTAAGYRRVAEDLEQITGAKLTDGALEASIAVYNAHNAAMRRLGHVLAGRGDVSARDRSAIYKSAWFMRKEEHTALVEELLVALEGPAADTAKIKVVTTGILCDSPALLGLFDKLGFQIAADDVAAESRQYRADTPEGGAPLERLAQKFAAMGHCSVLYDPDKTRADLIVSQARATGAKGVVVVLTKFCDPEEFDYVMIKKACDAAALPVALIEVDRQMNEFGQAETMLQTFRDLL